MPYLVVLPNHNIICIIPLVNPCIAPPIDPAHRNSLDSRLLATNQVDNLCPILCLSHSFYIILHFIVFFKFPVNYLVRCGAISCILCPVPPSCEPLLCAFTLPFICTLSAHPSSSLLQQSLYHIELCLQLHLQSEGLNGCFHYTGSALIFSENGIGARFSPVGRPSEQGWSIYPQHSKI